MRFTVLLVLLLGCADSSSPTDAMMDAGGDAATEDAGVDADESGAGCWTPVDEETGSRLRMGLVGALEAGSVPGVAMAVAYAESETLWAGAAGDAEIATGEAWTSERASRIGSVTKTFTAAIILQLVDEGALALSDPLSRWVPGYFDGVGVTVEHLITNTSGIGNYNWIGDFDTSRAWTPRELVEWAVTHEPMLRFAPGSRWEYSNTNYVLLGLVIEAVTGNSYGDELETRLLEPLGLNNTYLAGARDANPSLVNAYDLDDVDISRDHDPSLGWAAGGMVSTPCDLARWGAALYGGDVLSPRMRELLVTPVSSVAGDYGHGSFVEVEGSAALYGHTGGIGGYGTYMYYWAEDEVVLVLMRNGISDVSLRAMAQYGWYAALELEGSP